MPLIGLTAVAVAVGLAARLAILGTGSLWLDELWTLDAVSRSFKEMIGARLVSDQSPPLSTSVTWLWLQITGSYDAAVMRSLSLTTMALAIGAPLIGAAKLPGLRPTLLVMASLMSLSIFTIHYSVELRPYAMMIGLASAATVVWAGLLLGRLPRTVPYLFAFAVLGALAGFAHYYGNLVYVAESGMLLAAFLHARARRLAMIHTFLFILSIVPVVGWYVFTRPWAPNQPVAGPPTVSTALSVVDYALAPLSTVLRGETPGYPALGPASTLLLAVVGTLGAFALVHALRSGSAETEGPRDIAVLGVAGGIVVLVGVAGAWTASLLLPPSMNLRNLSALLPPLFLSLAAAATAVPARVRPLAGSAIVALFLGAFAVVIVQHGVGSLVPPWQQGAGYGPTTRMLLGAVESPRSPQLIGVETTWQWHGHWDAAVRSELGSPPAESADQPPLDVTWVSDTGSLAQLQADPDGVILFTDTTDERWSSAVNWAEQGHGACEAATYGGVTSSGVDEFGRVFVVTCR